MPFRSRERAFRRERACYDAGIAEEIHDQLTGHAGKSVGREYGGGASLDTLYERMASVEVPVDLSRFYVHTAAERGARPVKRAAA